MIIQQSKQSLTARSSAINLRFQSQSVSDFQWPLGRKYNIVIIVKGDLHIVWELPDNTWNYGRIRCKSGMFTESSQTSLLVRGKELSLESGSKIFLSYWYCTLWNRMMAALSIWYNEFYIFSFIAIQNSGFRCLRKTENHCTYAHSWNILVLMFEYWCMFIRNISGPTVKAVVQCQISGQTCLI